VATQDFN